MANNKGNPTVESFKKKIIQVGEVRNPSGKPKGTKDARTIVREFMDKTVDTLEGTRVTRFQYMLWSMYEINQRLIKQLDYRSGEVAKAKNEIELIKEKGKDGISDIILDADKKEELERKKIASLDYAEKQLRKRNNEYENLLRQVQESQGKLSEFFLKASGQYLEKKEIASTINQPLLVTCNKKELQEAMREIDDEC